MDGGGMVALPCCSSLFIPKLPRMISSCLSKLEAARFSRFGFEALFDNKSGHAKVASGVGVLINANGQLGTVVSSARFKDDIRPMDKSSEAILALQPVTFRYKKDLDPDSSRSLAW
jgi:hypothetical protein